MLLVFTTASVSMVLYQDSIELLRFNKDVLEVLQKVLQNLDTGCIEVDCWEVWTPTKICIGGPKNEESPNKNAICLQFIIINYKVAILSCQIFSVQNLENCRKTALGRDFTKVITKCIIT